VSEGRSHGIHRSRVFVGVTTALSVLCFVVVVARFAVLAR
jgi:hypothetical protein